MTKQLVLEHIFRLFEDPNGFLVQLQVQAKFNQQLYQEIFQTFTQYNELLANEEDINRRAARFLVDLATALEGAAYQFSLIEHTDTEKVGKAHAEVLNLMYELLP